MKNLEKYASGMSPHKFTFALKSLHSLACFWAREYGLWRRHPKYQIESFLFQYLYSHRENGVYKMITRAIRHHLSKDTAKNEKDEFSSKSIHIAPITNMVDHRGVYFFDIHAKSGHSIGTNQERYLDRNNLAMNLAGEYALHGWVDETPKKSYQTFH